MTSRKQLPHSSSSVDGGQRRTQNPAILSAYEARHLPPKAKDLAHDTTVRSPQYVEM